VPNAESLEPGLNSSRGPATARKRTEIEDLVRGIHRIAGLRERVTIESIPVPPVLSISKGEWVITALLVVPTRTPDGVIVWLAPWAAVQWHWPSGSADLLDLRQVEGFRRMRAKGAHPCPNAPQGSSTSLYQALDSALQSPPTKSPGLSSLSPFYSNLLPLGLYEYYWALVPSTRSWLRTPAASHHPEVSSGADGVIPSLDDSVHCSLDRAIELSIQFGFRDIQEELEALKARQMESGRTLAFVGEFSRGKSHLINRLLERDVLPTGVLPTTQALTSLSHAAKAKERIEIVSLQGGTEVRPLVEASWSDLRAFGDDGSSTEISATVRVRVDNQWLKSLDADIIDTPGLGDLCAQRTAAVEDFLYRCDAVVLVVSAKSPFGITERTFLRDHVLARHVPAILVVVSMLDLVPPGERSAVLRDIQHKVSAVSEQIQVLPSRAVGAETEENALALVRASIQTLLSPACWKERRLRQVASLLSDHLSVLAHLGHSGLQQGAVDQAARASTVAAARGRLESTEQEWQFLMLELDRRCLRSSEDFRSHLMSRRDELSELLCFEVMKSSDPKTWWEQDFPFRMRREFAALGRRSEDFMQKAITADSEWLRQEAQKLFGIEVPPKANQTAPAPPAVDENFGRTLNLTSLKHFKEFSLMGSGAAMTFAYLLQGPAALAIGLGLAVAYGGRQMLGGKTKEQQLTVAENIYPAIESALDSYSAQTASRLRKLYAVHAESVKQTFRHWLSAQASALENTGGYDAVDWQRLIDSAETLRAEVAGTLEGDTVWMS
jgi:predicted GTPase